MCIKVVIAALTLAPIQFSIVRTHFREYIIYAQSSVYQKELNSREKSSFSIKTGSTVRVLCRAARSDSK